MTLSKVSSRTSLFLHLPVVSVLRQTLPGLHSSTCFLGSSCHVRSWGHGDHKGDPRSTAQWETPGCPSHYNAGGQRRKHRRRGWSGDGDPPTRGPRGAFRSSRALLQTEPQRNRVAVQSVPQPAQLRPSPPSHPARSGSSGPRGQRGPLRGRHLTGDALTAQPSSRLRPRHSCRVTDTGAEGLSSHPG